MKTYHIILAAGFIALLGGISLVFLDYGFYGFMITVSGLAMIVLGAFEFDTKIL